MDVEDFKKKYEQLKDNPMYKNFCSILDTKSQVLERTAKENQELKEQLEASEKARKESMLILGEYRHYTLPTEEQNRENEGIVAKAYNNLILKQDIDKGE